MARLIEFSRRSTAQLQKILTFYDERNGSDEYSRRLLSNLMISLEGLAVMPTASSPSTRDDVRFFYLMGFAIIFRYNSRKLTVLSIRSTVQKPLKLYQKI
jgi:plasmid stabilization system protein ParE